MYEYSYFEDYVIGEKWHTAGRTITETDIRFFIGATDDTHPVHVDKNFCKQHAAVSTCVVQGVLVLGIADGLIAREVLPLKVSVLHYGCDKVRFTKPVYCGDTVYCDIALSGKKKKNEEYGILIFDVDVKNQCDETIVRFIDMQYIKCRKADMT